MAASTSAQGKPVAARNAAPAPRKEKPAPSAGKKSQRLGVRHYAVMKAQRVYPLLVEVPKSGDGEGGVVVVRPVIAGAVVAPAEQRLDLATPGNQVTFQVTPLARGRLPDAHVEVFAAGQARQDVPTPMKVKRQWLTWLLLALAVLVPWGVWRLVREDVNDYLARGFARSELADYEKPQRDGFLALRGQKFADRTAKAMREDWIKLPFLNTEFNADPEAAAWTRYRLSDDVGGFLDVVYGDLIQGVARYRLLPGLAILFLGLALISWLMHRPRTVWTRKAIHPGTAAAETAEAATLQPLA